VSGRCAYPEKAARYAAETTLILCDTISIQRSAAQSTFDFRQRSWGSMARFSGPVSGERMTVSSLALRDGKVRAATGTCQVFYRSDGKLSAISCLARAGTRSIAANFIPSRL
jgi:hypothetical protein